MSANIIRLLPDEERALFDCYVTGSDQPASFQQLFDTGGPQQRNAGSLQIAVAQILLHHVQDSLPQWAAIYARLQFTPRLLFSINWATSGPGFEWPEAYHVTYVPRLEKHIFTASRDGPDAFGWRGAPGVPSILGPPRCLLFIPPGEGQPDIRSIHKKRKLL